MVYAEYSPGTVKLISQEVLSRRSCSILVSWHLKKSFRSRNLHWIVRKTSQRRSSKSSWKSGLNRMLTNIRIRNRKWNRNRKLNPTWPETISLSSNSPFAVFAASVEEPREEPELVRRSSVRFGLVVARVLDDGSENFVVGLGPEVVEAGDEKERAFLRTEILTDSNPRPLCQEACALPLCCNRSPSYYHSRYPLSVM